MSRRSLHTPEPVTETLHTEVSRAIIAAGRVYLVVTSAPGGPRVIEIEEGAEQVIGRGEDAAIRLEDGHASRHHAKIVRRGVLEVHDLGSRNGTRVNGVVLRNQAREIGGGDVLRVGRSELVVAVSAAPPERPGLEHEAEDVVIVDPAMVEVFSIARRVAQAPTTSLVLMGETGVGKEVLARYVHAESPRREGPFVAVNCAALPSQLVESELFGHERGAFTGAVERKTGLFEAAQGGTLLLDEIGDLPLELQGKLLRALEQRTINRLGSTKEIPIDLRIIGATHRDLEASSRDGSFRQDLYYRLATFVIEVPPLRRRPHEIVVLAQRFAQEFAKRLEEPVPWLGSAAREALVAYRWPGNVRELRNAMERAVILAGGGEITLAHLPSSLSRSTASAPSSGAAEMKERVEDLERRSIAQALHDSSGNRTRAAQRLGISRRSLIYKLKKYGLS